MEHQIPNPIVMQQQQVKVPPPTSGVAPPTGAVPFQQQQQLYTTVSNPVGGSSSVAEQVAVPPTTSTYPSTQTSSSFAPLILQSPPTLNNITTPVAPTLLVAPAPVAPTIQHYNGSLNGCWILDKTRGEWSMKRYLEVMKVDPLAIEAHSKGEIEFDTIISIEITSSDVTLIKRSRVNNDIVVKCPLNDEQIEYLPPGNRIKKTLATLLPSSTSKDPSLTGILQIHNSLHTMNGLATVIDKRIYIPHDPYTDTSVVRQELTIINEETKESHTTIRFFNPIPSMDYTNNNNTDEITNTIESEASLPTLPLITTSTTRTIASNMKDTEDVVMEDTMTTATTVPNLLTNNNNINNNNNNQPTVAVMVPATIATVVASGQQQQPAPPPQGFLPSLLLLDQQQQQQPTSF